MKMDIFKMSKIEKPKIVLKKTLQKCPCDENAHKISVSMCQCVTISFFTKMMEISGVFFVRV